jgi:type IV pilus assembly protein PilW
MTRPTHPATRGVTLVELLVALAIGAIVLAAVFGVVQSQQRAYFQGHLQRAAQQSARSALAFIEQRLSLAGYGMDAPLAFDFRWYGAPPDGPQPCPSAASPCVRDRTDGNDELVFYARDPRYWAPEAHDLDPRGNAWRVLGLDLGSVTLSARKDDVFEKGRILQLLCPRGAKYAYMTVAQTVGPLAADAPAPGGVTIRLEAPITSPPNDSNPFRQQDAAVADTCFTNPVAPARAYFIDRYRFHVRPVAVGATQEPFLVLDTGLDRNMDGPDEGEEIVLAGGIESFQVGYLLTNGSLAPRGTTPGSAIAFTSGPIAGASQSGNGITTLQFPGVVPPDKWLYEPTSFYGIAASPMGTIPATRLTDHQANIRAVRIAIVARGPEPEPAAARIQNLLPVLNQDRLPAWISPTVPYNRARIETTVIVQNMVARAMNDF